MTVDWAEERVYVGSADGRIYQVELMDQQSNQQQHHHHQDEAQSDDEDEGEGEKEPGRHQRRRRTTKFLGHEKSVTCLSVSMDGSRLLSGKLR